MATKPMNPSLICFLMNVGMKNTHTHTKLFNWKIIPKISSRNSEKWKFFDAIEGVCVNFVSPFSVLCFLMEKVSIFLDMWNVASALKNPKLHFCFSSPFNSKQWIASKWSKNSKLSCKCAFHCSMKTYKKNEKFLAECVCEAFESVQILSINFLLTCTIEIAKCASLRECMREKEEFGGGWESSFRCF